MNELNVNEKESAREDLYGIGIELYGLSYSLHRDDCKTENSRPKFLMTNEQMIEWQKNLVSGHCFGCEVHQMANRLHNYEEPVLIA